MNNRSPAPMRPTRRRSTRWRSTRRSPTSSRPPNLSLQRYAIGLAIGIPTGAVLGLLIGTSGWVRGLLNDTFVLFITLLDRLVLRRLERYAFQWNQQPTLTFAEDFGV